MYEYKNNIGRYKKNNNERRIPQNENFSNENSNNTSDTLRLEMNI